MSYGQGDHLVLSSIHSTVHLGAHVDGPNHYSPGGVGIDQRPLELYLGPCQVLSVAVARGERILPEHVTVPITAERILFCTGTYPDPEDFNEDFASLSPQLVDWLADQGVRLVGIDTPSVDPFESTALESHNALASTGMACSNRMIPRS